MPTSHDVYSGSRARCLVEYVGNGHHSTTYEGTFGPLTRFSKYQPAGGILFIRTYFEDVLKSIDRWSFGERRNKGHYVDSVTNMITLKISCLKGNLIAKKNQKILL